METKAKIDVAKEWESLSCAVLTRELWKKKKSFLVRLQADLS